MRSIYYYYNENRDNSNEIESTKIEEEEVDCFKIDES